MPSLFYLQRGDLVAIMRRALYKTPINAAVPRKEKADTVTPPSYCTV
jgi:hypothetical protein